MIVNVKKVYTYMRHKYDIRKSSNGWYSFICPYCGGGRSKEISGAVNFTMQIIKCWRINRCGYKGRLDEFIMEQENLDWRQLRTFINQYDETDINLSDKYTKAINRHGNIVKKIELPYSYKTLCEGNGGMAKKARMYLEKRGFDVDKLDYQGFGYCDQEHKEWKKNFYGFIIIPYYSDKGYLHYYIGRDFLNRDEKWKYKNPDKNLFSVGKSDIFYNEAALNGERLFLVEGWACAETIGSEAVATSGWNLSQVQKSKILRSQVKELVFVPDTGAYRNALKTVMDFVSGFDVKVLNFDLLQDYGNDVNSAGYDRFYDLYEKSEILSMSDIVEKLMGNA